MTARALVALLLLLAGGCADRGGDDDRAAPTTTRPAGTTRAVCATGSSPAIFDDERGQYAVYLTSIDPGRRTVGFNVIQFLVGDDAAEADPDDDADYAIVDENPLTREAPVAEDVTVWLVHLRDDANADLTADDFDAMSGYVKDYEPVDDPWLSYNPFWLTMSGGTVVDICEQYLP